MAAAQDLKNHRKLVPLYHFFVLPVFLAKFIWEIIDVVGEVHPRALFEVLVAFALLMTALYVRTKAAGNQDRIIRLEERLRMRSVLPADMHGDIDKLTTGQLIGLRFASDEELPDLTRKALAENLDKEEVKKHIKHWRADHQRI